MLRWNIYRLPLGLAGPILLLAATAAGEERSDSLNPGDLGHAVVSLIIFVLLVMVLRKWAWNPLVAQLHRREQGIADALRRSEEREKEAQDLLAQYRGRLDKTEVEVSELLKQGRKQAAEAREQVLAAARGEARQTVHAAREEIESAKNAALRELQAGTAEMATDMAEHIIGRVLKDEDHRRMVEESLQAIQGRSGRRS